MTTSTAVFSTSTTGGSVLENLSSSLREKLGFSESPEKPESLEDGYGPWCFVCSRPTEHVGEHDDLLEKGLISYERNGSVSWLKDSSKAS